MATEVPRPRWTSRSSCRARSSAATRHLLEAAHHAGTEPGPAAPMDANEFTSQGSSPRWSSREAIDTNSKLVLELSTIESSGTSRHGHVGARSRSTYRVGLGASGEGVYRYGWPRSGQDHDHGPGRQGREPKSRRRSAATGENWRAGDGLDGARAAAGITRAASRRRAPTAPIVATKTSPARSKGSSRARNGILLFVAGATVPMSAVSTCASRCRPAMPSSGYKKIHEAGSRRTSCSSPVLWCSGLNAQSRAMGMISKNTADADHRYKAVSPMIYW